MQPNSSVGLAMIMLGIAGSISSAQVSLVSQSQLVHIGSGYDCQEFFRPPCSGGGSHNFTAPDFNPFTVSDTVQHAYGFATGQYASTLAPDHIHLATSAHLLLDLPFSHVVAVSQAETTTQVT